MAAHYCISYPCPLCHPGGYPMPYYALPPAPTYTCSPGCICPPTSEKTCESPVCPRKGFKFSAAGPALNGERQ
jgi:hypothetical protein